MQRLDLILRPSVWMRRMYSLVITDDSLYMLHTGPGIRINMSTAGFGAAGVERLAAGMAKNAVIKRGLDKIHAAEAEITPDGLDAFVSRHKNSGRVALASISNVKIATNNRKISFQATDGKHTFSFEFCNNADVEAFLQVFPLARQPARG